MNHVVSVILFAIGFVFVIKGASYLIDGASALAKKLAVPEIVIALTIVAFGTSTPELTVNVFATLGGKSEIALGNIIGSNIFNILLILGISGLIGTLDVQKNTVWREIPFSLFATLMLFILVNDRLIFGAETDALSLFDGFLLILFFAVFIIYIFGISKIKTTDRYEVHDESSLRICVYIAVGFIGLFYGGKIIVDSAVEIARWLQVGEKLLAITIVAAGTSLPELATSAVAAYKGKNDIAIGNVVGSNIFNICFILGVGAIIRSTNYSSSFNFDLHLLTAATLMLFFAMFTGRRQVLDKWEAYIFLFLYLGYLAFLIIKP